MPKKLATVACFLLTTGLMVGCTKSSVSDDMAPAELTASMSSSDGLTVPPDVGTSGVPLPPGSVPPTVVTDAPLTGGLFPPNSGSTSIYTQNVTWNNRLDGSYTISQATQDYNKPVNGWAPTRMSITGGKLKTTLTKNVVGPAGGLVSWIDVPDGSEYEMSYDFMFDQNFDFSWGGKLGWGFLIGDGFTGGTPGTNGNGGSVRLMWYKNWSNGPVFVKPYIYYKDQSGQYGSDFGKTYPSSGSVAKGVWHTVKMYVKCNNGSNTDGRLKITINGSTLVDMPIRYTTNDAKRLINRITFETFRGGADASWTTPTDGTIYFDNLSWKQMQ